MNNNENSQLFLNQLMLRKQILVGFKFNDREKLTKTYKC